MSLQFKALRTGTIQFSKKRSMPCVEGETYTLNPSSNDDALAAVANQRAGYIQILGGDDTSSPVLVRQVKRNQILVFLGNNSDALPNGVTTYTLSISGETFVFGDGHIDGANATAQLAAFKTAFEANATLAALGMVYAGGAVLGTYQAVAVLNGDSVADWATLAATVTDDTTDKLTAVVRSAAAEDSAVQETVVLMEHTVDADDVTRGVIAFDTGLTDLSALTAEGDTPWIPIRIQRTSKATKTGTFSNTGTDGDTITIAGRVYTLVDTLSGDADEVLIGVSAAATRNNLVAAINGAAGEGSTYGTGTEAHASVSAATSSTADIVITAILPGSDGNALALAESSTHFSWAGGATVLAGGGTVTVIAHDGAQQVVDGRVLMVTNSGSVDWQAYDNIRVMARGAD